MLARTSTLNVELAKQFAWLLRQDVRDAYPSRDDPGFEEWWLVKGRIDFPGWADAVEPQELKALFEPHGAASVAGVAFQVPKIAALLAKHRLDALREFTRDGQVQNEVFFAWVVVRGLAEHRLLLHVPKDFLATLDQPVPETLPQASQADAPPAATLLMYLVWLLMDKATQENKNLFTLEGRKVFLPWFFGAVQALGLGPLVAGRWKSWLKTQPGFQAAQHPWAFPAQAKLAAKANTSPKPFGLNIYGFAYGELGIGEDLRMAVECCEAAGIPFHVVNVDAGDTGQADRHLQGKVRELADDELPPYSTNLFCLPAFDTVNRIFMQKGAAVFTGYRNIGWWPWELAVFPKAWRPFAFELVDEVWASSQFLMDMYSAATDKPVKLVPLAVSVARMKPHPRKYYGLPEKKFLFLYIFDFNSSVARKNPMAAVQAFKQAFKSTDNTVGLVLKTMNTDPKNQNWKNFISECNKDKRIQIITHTMQRPEVLGLINCCDAYVSLHRSEGFGRTVAEAILLNKPSLATGYSGNVDFDFSKLYRNVKFNLMGVENYHWISPEDNARWAEVQISDAAEKLLKIKEDKSAKKNNQNDRFSVQYVSSIIKKQLSSLSN